MTLDTVTFFQVVLAGFVFVWTFRHFTHSEKKMGEFEWLASSALWGVVFLAVFAQLFQGYPKIKELLANPLATCVVVSFFGFAVAYLLVRVWYSTKTIREMNWFKKIVSFLKPY